MADPRIPITTLIDLDSLDDAEVLVGYRDGLEGDQEPGDNRSLSYWHGWRNGRVDGGHTLKDAAQARLAREVVRSRRRRSQGTKPK